MNKYKVKEIFYTLQGEGAYTGKPAVFCRFSGCNLWSGREEDRHKAICQFCDTDFWGMDGENGGAYTATELAKIIRALWPEESVDPIFVVCTGGEPLLQLDDNLIKVLHEYDCFIAIESNGTIIVPPGVDWVCISPKANADLLVLEGDELKLVYPQKGGEPSNYEHLRFQHFYLQPMDGPDQKMNTQSVLEYCLANPKWKMSLQTHKILGID